MNSWPDLTAPLLLGALALFSSVLRAQSPSAATQPCKLVPPELRTLLDKAAAERGLTAKAEPRTLAFRGTFSVSFEGQPEPVAKGSFGEYFRGLDLARHVSDLGDQGTMEKGVHRDVVWEIDPMLGAKVHTGVNAAANRRYFALLRGDDPRAVYRTIETTGAETIDGTACTVLRMSPPEGKPDTWFVGGDGTVVRIHIALAAPESADAAFDIDDLQDAKLTFADWRRVDGGRFPMTRRLQMGPATVAFTVEHATVGVDIADEKFTPPKAVLEKKGVAAAPAFGADGKPTYQVVDKQPQPVASIRVTVPESAIASQLGVLLPEVMQHLNATGSQPAGPPFTRYHTMEAGSIELEAGIPVHKPITEKGRIKNGELPGGKAVTCWHVGPYDGLRDAHAGLQAFLAKDKLAARGGVWEVYWTDPGMVTDPSKWKTQLFAPIR